MSSQSFLLSQDVTYPPTQRNRCPHRPTGTFPLGTRLCVQCQHMSHMFAQLTHTRPCNCEVSTLIPFVTPQTQPLVPGVRLAGSRLSPKTNTSLFCALCPHS